MSDLEIDYEAIHVQVSKDWKDGDTVQQCRNALVAPLGTASFAVGAGHDVYTAGFQRLIAALSEFGSTMDAGLNELYQAFTVLGSADSAVGANFDRTDAINRRLFAHIEGHIPQIN